MRKNSPKDREDYLEEAADIYELKGQHNRTAIIRGILRVEELRRTYGHIRYSINQRDGGEITQVQYPTHNGWKLTTDPKDMETRINKQQSKHFSKANSTPVAQYFQHHPEGTTELFQNFSQSKILDTTKGLKEWFNRTTSEEISISITPRDFQQGIKKWRERTSTSPSGRHLGHYHAESLPNMGEEQGDWTGVFMWIHSSVVNLAIKNGVVLERWDQVNTILQPKDKGIPKISRLRPLNLYEVDVNLALRVVLACRLLNTTEREGKLDDKTWGSRKQRAAGDLRLKKLLTYELSALRRTTLRQIDLDAKSCYDRMTRELAIQTCYTFGTPEIFCLWLYSLLRNQKHYILLPSGKSEIPYGHSKQQHHHGIGQGSTAAPVVWLLISSLMFQSMRGWATGVKWGSPDGKITTHQVADVYVDDATLWINQINSPQQLVRRMESDLNDYQEMLRWTGGGVNAS